MRKTFAPSNPEDYEYAKSFILRGHCATSYSLLDASMKLRLIQLVIRRRPRLSRMRSVARSIPTRPKLTNLKSLRNPLFLNRNLPPRASGPSSLYPTPVEHPAIPDVRSRGGRVLSNGMRSQWSGTRRSFERGNNVTVEGELWCEGCGPPGAATSHEQEGMSVGRGPRRGELRKYMILPSV